MLNIESRLWKYGLILKELIVEESWSHVEMLEIQQLWNHSLVLSIIHF